MTVLFCEFFYSYAVATCSDFLVRGVVWRRRAFRGLGLNNSSEKFGRNVHVHSFQFLRTRFFWLPDKRRPSERKLIVRRKLLNILTAWSKFTFLYGTNYCCSKGQSSGVAKGGGQGEKAPQSSKQNISIRINCTKFANLVSLFSGK